MKATLVYNLPDEQEEFEIAVNAHRWRYAMWEIDNTMRSNIKHPHESTSKEEIKTYEKVKELIRETLTAYNLTL
jgi:hypothetical protein